MRILLIEDHRDVADTIGDYLSPRGHRLDIATDGESGYHSAISRNYDVLIVDRILPGMDGATLCSRLRNEAGNNTPVLMLTALTTTSDKVSGFSSGADDYLVKPFDLSELEARLLALCRRHRVAVGGQRLQIADLVYDINTQQVRRAGRDISLSPSGRRILEYLMRHPRRVVSREELEEQLWGAQRPEGEVLRVHVHALRSAIDGDRPRKLLHTVRGAGYRLALLDEP